MVIRSFALLLLFSWAASASAQTGTEQPAGDKPDAAAAADAQTPDGPRPPDPALLKAGLAVLEKLEPIPDGEKVSLYFEMMMGPEQSIGYAGVTLEAAQEGKEPIYKYDLESAMTFPSGDKIIATVSARLKRNFEPIEIAGWRGRLAPDGEQTGAHERAKIGTDKVVLTTGEGDDRIKREVPRPEPPFIYGIEYLAASLDLSNREPFVLREFDMRSGGVRDLNMVVNDWLDGSPTFVTTTMEGAPSYQFWYDDKGQLIRWGEATMPMIFRRVTLGRFNDLVTLNGRFRRYLPLGKAYTDKATTPKTP